MSYEIDVFDQAALTDVINRSFQSREDGSPSVGAQIAPLRPVQSRSVKVNGRIVNGNGLGQLRAPGATPPLYEPTASFEESVIELALPDEMHRINEEDYLALRSNDVNYRRKAGVELVERVESLVVRNINRTEKMRWEAFSGEVTLEYASGATLTVDYDVPATNKPSASVPWQNTATSDPIADLKAWQKLTANEVGAYGTKIHMSSEAYDLMIASDKLVQKLTGSERPLYVPTRDDVLSLLRAGTEIIIYDGGWRPDGSSDRGIDGLNRFLPKDKVLITTDYSLNGQRIADTPDGQVLVGNSINSAPVIRQGAQTEIIYDQISHEHLVRYASARIVRLHEPGAFVYADVGTVV